MLWGTGNYATGDRIIEARIVGEGEFDAHCHVPGLLGVDLLYSQ